jgi:hypothetical protein
MRSTGSRLAGLTTCVLLLGAAGCGEISAPDPASEPPAFARAEVVTEITVENWDFTDFALCTNELVHWTGKAVFKYHEASNRGAPPVSDEGVQFFIFSVSINLTGVGEISGETYTFHSSLLDNVQSVSPTEPFPTAHRFFFYDRVTGPGGFLGYATFSFITVLNGTGDLVIDEVLFDNFECR